MLCAFSQALLQNCNVAFPKGFCTAGYKVTGKPRQCREEVICSSGLPAASPKFKFEILSLQFNFQITCASSVIPTHAVVVFWVI